MTGDKTDWDSQQETKEKWDAFKDPPIIRETGSMEQSTLLDFCTKLSKLLAYLVAFAVVLGAAVVSKGTILFMTSQIAPNRTLPYCNKNLGIYKEYVVTLPRTERLAWMWVIIFSYFVVELATFIRSLRICLFKIWSMPTRKEQIFLFITESLPAVGSALLVFCILPELDVLKGVMLTNAVCFVPAVAGFISRNYSELSERKNELLLKIMKPNINTILDVFSILAQATAFIVWPIMGDKLSLWIIPLSVLLISFGWLENYLPKKYLTRENTGHNNYKEVEWKFENGRYFVYLFLSIWKCALFLVTALTIIWIKESNIEFVFEDFVKAFKVHQIGVTEIKPVISSETSYNIEEVIHVGKTVTVPSNHLTPVWVFLINILSTYICYAFGKFACKIRIQAFGYAFPINLAVPVTVTLLILLCGLHNADACAFTKTIPSYIFFNGPPVYVLWDFIGSQQAWIWFLWLLSQTWITIHLWSPESEKLASTENLYVKPMYDSFLIDQSIAMNRRKDNQPKGANDNESEVNETNNESLIPESNSETTRIFVCATMWHESKEEMMEFLKSVMRLDEDQFAHQMIRDDIKMYRKDYYKLQIHIFFDDAFVRKDKNNDDDLKLNEYVKTLVLCVNEAIEKVYLLKIKKKDPKKYVTPYGGRLEWRLPGLTKMIVHLKDKKKIRHKKRWSQVMYMYYLLGYRLRGRNYTKSTIENRSKNTFILALDGDIDFQPNAVHHLITLMKKDLKLGAACGRIHPIGSGPMVWYQIFEYSIGHWLQKSTENMIGCVLCSPGCFSLFRAKALMEDNVLAKYTSRSELARHFVQYDQGEDRWLCTLLLQRGYKVEYCAASDSYTHAPEKFNEFYNQRRRWIPSTTANIMDLLMDYKHTVKMNDNISILYIWYQALLMIGTVLGPGTIFLMLVGAFVAAFQFSQWESFIWNALPVTFYMCICYWCKSDVQLFFAGLLSAIYGLVMMAVLVGIFLQISVDGPLAPSSLFLFLTGFQLFVAGLLHPKEVGNLKYIFVYYITIPSMYLLLIIYSIFNLNETSWGTRTETIAPNEPDKAKDPTSKDGTSNKKAAQNTVVNVFDSEQIQKKTGSLEFSLAGLFTCMLCTHSKTSEENVQLLEILHSIDKVSNRLNEIEKSIQEKSNNTLDTVRLQPHGILLGEEVKDSDVHLPTEPTISSIAQKKSRVLSPTWVDEEVIEYGVFDCISKPERKFWEKLVNSKKFLKPYEDNKEQVEKDLKDLRDISVTAFIMANAIFVLVVFLLTLKKDLLHIKWPLDPKVNFTYIDSNREIKIYKEYLQLEPIGIVFVAFFAILLVIQFISLVFHRFGTFTQILASTYINWSLNKKTVSKYQLLEDDPVRAIKQFIRPSKHKEPPVELRKTIKHRLPAYEEEVYDLKEAYERQQKNVDGEKQEEAKAIARMTKKFRGGPGPTVTHIANDHNGSTA